MSVLYTCKSRNNELFGYGNEKKKIREREDIGCTRKDEKGELAEQGERNRNKTKRERELSKKKKRKNCDIGR